MPAPQSLAQRRIRIAREERRARLTGSPDLVTEARRDYAAEKLAAYIERVVADAPPLTAGQRDRLALLLRSGGSDAA